MTTRALIPHALLTATLIFPSALAVAAPRPLQAPTPTQGPRPTPAPRPAPQPQPRQQTPEFIPLTLGQDVVGGINNRDFATPQGFFTDYYHVQLTQGENYHFSVTGQGYPASVQVLDADANPLEGTKTSADEHSFTIFTAETGVYTVAVTTQNPADSGRYMLRSAQGIQPPAPRPNQTGEVAVPQGTEPFTGNLNDQSNQSAQGRYFEYSVVELEAGTEYCLHAQSSDDGVFVDIVSIDNHPVEFLAIEQDGAYIRVTPTVSGPHALSTIAKQPNQNARYTGYAWVHSTGSSQTIVDQLSDESIRLDNGCYFDFHEIELVADTAYVIDVTSDDFDTIAYLFDADNNQLVENDNAQDGHTNAQITFTPQASGTYSVGVSSSAADATGGYMVRVASGDRIGQDPGVRVTRGNDTDDRNDTNTGPIVGHWQLIQVQQGDQAPQEVPAGAAVYVLGNDGTTAYYEDGKIVERGTYTLEGDQMTMTDPAGEAETSTVRVQGDTLTVNLLSPGGQPVTLTLERTDADAPAPQANTDPAIHGRWEATSVRANNADNEIPAGALAFEFLQDGTFNSYENGQRTSQGTYTTTQDRLDITVEGTTENNTYQTQGNTLAINTIIPPNTPAVITLRKKE